MKELITPCLWFNGQAQEAGALYCSLFENTKIASQSPMVTEVVFSGQHVTLLDGGPMYQPNPSISFFYICETEAELIRIWNGLVKSGTILMPLDKYDWSSMYGWINDQFGISWQLLLGKREDVGQLLTPCFLFSGKEYGNAEEAIHHYSAIFKNAKTDGILRYEKNEAPETEGKIKHAQVGLDGQKFMFMDSALEHKFIFSEGVSLTIHCETQEEIDYYWDRLTENGEESRCGWLKDKFGVSWQVIPNILNTLLSDPGKAGKTAKAFMEMRKFDIEQLVQAAAS